MPTVHEKIPNILIVGPAVIVHAVIQNHKRARIQLGFNSLALVLHIFCNNHLLTLDEIGKNDGIKFAVDKEWRDHFSVEGVRLFCTTDDGS